jgi:hypothetical protein
MKKNTKGKTIITPEVIARINKDEDRVTIVHCRYYTAIPVMARVWPTTYLIENSGRIRELLHAINIRVSPKYQIYEIYAGYIYFTLIFEGLSDDCTSFHIEEIIPETNGFISDETPRNKQDVYQIEVLAP